MTWSSASWASSLLLLPWFRTCQILPVLLHLLAIWIPGLIKKTSNAFSIEVPEMSQKYERAYHSPQNPQWLYRIKSNSGSLWLSLVKLSWFLSCYGIANMPPYTVRIRQLVSPQKQYCTSILCHNAWSSFSCLICLANPYLSLLPPNLLWTCLPQSMSWLVLFIVKRHFVISIPFLCSSCNLLHLSLWHP